MKNQYSEEEYLKDQKPEAKDTKALEIAKKMLNAGMDMETITTGIAYYPCLYAIPVVFNNGVGTLVVPLRGY